MRDAAVTLASTDDSTWKLRAHANVLYVIFPNTLVLVEPDHAAVVTMFPDGAARTSMRAFTLVPEPPATD